MLNNDVLRSVRYILDVSDSKIAEIAALAGGKLTRGDVWACLRKEGDEKYRECSDEELAYFLDGLVIHKRGRDESVPLRPIELPVTNNMVMKKLRVAFELQDEDMHAVLRVAGFPVSKPELSALFRKPGSKNYRPCGDQLLRNFLKGLAIKFRPANDDAGAPADEPE